MPDTEEAFRRFRLRAAGVVLVVIVAAALYDVFGPRPGPDIGVVLTLAGLELGLLGLGSVVRIVGPK